MTGLWEANTIDTRVSLPENERVLKLYWSEKVCLLGWDHPRGCKCRQCGDFRGDLARDWVRVAGKAGLYVPGSEARKPLRKGETELERRVDAARTRIRNFEAGTAQREWVLIGIETTICDRRGMAYPGPAYQTQGTLL